MAKKNHVVTKILTHVQITTYVEENGSTPIDRLYATTRNPRHVIGVKNITPVVRDVSIQGFLPSTQALVFDENGNRTNLWNSDIFAMNEDIYLERGCPLEHVLATHNAEPVHCSKVTVQQGTGGHVAEKNVPVVVTVIVT